MPRHNGRLVWLVAVLSACSAPPPHPNFLNGRVVLTGIDDASRVAVSLTQGQSLLGEVVTEADGKFHFEVPNKGVFTLRFLDPWSVEGEFLFDIFIEGPTDAPDTALTPLGRVIGNARPYPDCLGVVVETRIGETPLAPAQNGDLDARVPAGRQALRVSTPTWSEESVIEVAHGEPTVLELRGPPRTGSLRGRVLRTPAPPISGVSLTLSGPCDGATTTGPSGDYAFASLPAGRFQVDCAQPESTIPELSPLAFSRETFVIAGQETPVADFAWKPLAIVRGRVLRGDAGVERQRLCERPSFSYFDTSIQRVVGEQALSDSEGRYEIRAPLDVSEIGLCLYDSIYSGELGPITVPMNGATFGQVNVAPDLVLP